MRRAGQPGGVLLGRWLHGTQLLDERGASFADPGARAADVCGWDVPEEVPDTDFDAEEEIKSLEEEDDDLEDGIIDYDDADFY